MIEDNNIYSAEITGYGYDGEGVCRLDGKVCFVRYVLKNEKVSLKIKSSKSSFCKGELLKVLVKSPLREEAPCPYFTKCGGCVYQHTNYENELKIKLQLLKNQFSKIGYNKEINFVPSPKQYGYRNKIKLFVDRNKIGLKKNESNEIIDIDKCLLVDNLINKAIENIRVFINAQNLFDDISEIVIRQEENLCLINFIMKKNKVLNFQGLYLMLGSNFGIYQTYNKITTYEIGQKFLFANELGLSAKFNVNSFHQVNKYLTSQLYQKVVDSIMGDSVVNCYSGAGVLSGVLSKHCSRVVGIELGKAEHFDAEKLKEENGLFNLLNINGDCAKVLYNLDEDFETIIVDPPRAGIDKKVVESINNSLCKRLIYVSCNSATLIRDLSYLTSYQVCKVTLFDMFARTGEYETLVILNRKA